ncbi:flippase-like domain-containing protein [candidate division KSB1 bacterium]|nr:flippase-like domain-containing protein [candidate division KSB1 bacterium]
MAEKRLDNTTSFKQVLFTFLKICISGLLIWFLLARIGVNKLLAQLTAANIYWILASIFIFSLSNILGALQWYLLLKSKAIKLSLWRVIQFYHVGLFFNNFLIGYVGGDAFRIYDIRKSSGNTNGALTTVFFDRFIGFFTLSTLAVLVTLIWMKRLTSHVTVYTILIVFVIWVIGFYFLFQENVARKFSWLFRLFLPKMIHIKLKELYYELNKFRHNKILLLRIFVIAFGVQTLRILTHLFAARAVGVKLELLYFFIFVPIIALAASLPISLGGIGVREQSGVTLFTQVGVLSAKVVAFEFIAYLVGIVATIPGGLIFAFRKNHKKI